MDDARDADPSAATRLPATLSGPPAPKEGTTWTIFSSDRT